MTKEQMIAATPARIAKEYRAAYADHQAMIGKADTQALMRSADYLRTLKAAFQVAKESRF
jgi:hypothetical protein